VLPHREFADGSNRNGKGFSGTRRLGLKGMRGVSATKAAIPVGSSTVSIAGGGMGGVAELEAGAGCLCLKTSAPLRPPVRRTMANEVDRDVAAGGIYC
jgi:hypothetical protein